MTVKWPKILKNEKVQTAIMLAATVVGFVIFWYGLIAVFRTEHPLMAVATGSMRPTLEVGDLIIVQGGLNGNEIYAAPKDGDPPGDVIVFPGERVGRPGELIVHRAVEKTSDTNGLWHFKTQGDNNTRADPGDVVETEIVGKLVGKVPWLGWPNLFLQTFHGKVLIIVLLGVLIVIEFIPFSKKEKVEKDQTKPL
jgi:signal peptidase I